MDLIKREDAIKAIAEIMYDGSSGEKERIGMGRARDRVKGIPAVEPKQGEWIDMQRKMFKCSECGQIYQVLEPKNYCSNCGAKMKGAE